MDRFRHVRDRLRPVKAALLNHPVYQEIGRLDALRLFMTHHAFAVWDFMSLLKTLQQRLCCTAVPWLPAPDPLACRLVNEIVLAEESDDDDRGGFASHFELYHQAMTRCGANTAPINGFLSDLRRGVPVAAALDAPGVPDCARRFVEQTFTVIGGGDLCAIASAFTFGREDLLPDVFRSVVAGLATEAGGLAEFSYYLHRHIGVDENEHGPMANRLLLSLCGSDEARWSTVEQTASDCLNARWDLWDGIHDAIVRDEKATDTEAR